MEHNNILNPHNERVRGVFAASESTRDLHIIAVSLGLSSASEPSILQMGIKPAALAYVINVNTKYVASADAIYIENLKFIHAKHDSICTVLSM